MIAEICKTFKMDHENGHSLVAPDVVSSTLPPTSDEITTNKSISDHASHDDDGGGLNGVHEPAKVLDSSTETDHECDGNGLNGFHESAKVLDSPSEANVPDLLNETLTQQPDSDQMDSLEDSHKKDSTELEQGNSTMHDSTEATKSTPDEINNEEHDNESSMPHVKDSQHNHGLEEYDDDDDSDYASGESGSESADDDESFSEESMSEIDKKNILTSSATNGSFRRRPDYNDLVEKELADMPAEAKDIDMDSVRNYGASILAMAENSRATKLQEKFRRNSSSTPPPSTPPDAPVISSSPSLAVTKPPMPLPLPPRRSASIKINKSASGEFQYSPKRAESLRIMRGSGIHSEGDLNTPYISPSASHDTAESLPTTKTSTNMGQAISNADGLAVEHRQAREAGVNHFKVTLSRETQLAIQREIDAANGYRDPNSPGFARRALLGANSWLEQRRERRRKAEMERKMEEANRALEEMKRNSDTNIVYESSSDDEDMEVHVIPEPPSKYRPVPPILTKELMKDFAQQYLPVAVKMAKWKRLYSLTRDGDSFQTFIANVSDCQKTLLVIRTTREDVLGGYNEAPWESSHKHEEAAKFYGSGQSFLFKIGSAVTEDVSFAPMNLDNEGAGPSAPKGTDTPAKKERIVVFKWTGVNRYIQLCDASRKLIAMGGGGKQGAFGLCLEDDFSIGSSGPCDTFQNEPLASDETFDVLDMEVWGFLSYMF